MRDRIRDLTAAALFGKGTAYAQLSAPQKDRVDEIMERQQKFSRQAR
jgi:hypothetical protein